MGVIKAAYQDVLARDRHTVVSIFLTLPPEDVDMNVHPAKTEVRFQDVQKVRSLILSAIRTSIHAQSKQASSHVAQATHSAAGGPNVVPMQQTRMPLATAHRPSYSPPPQPISRPVASSYFAEAEQTYEAPFEPAAN